MSEATPASASPAEQDTFRLELTPAELKVTYTGLRSILNDFGRDQRDVHDIIKAVLAKFPDEATIRQIPLGGRVRHH